MTSDVITNLTVIISRDLWVNSSPETPSVKVIRRIAAEVPRDHVVTSLVTSAETEEERRVKELQERVVKQQHKQCLEYTQVNYLM